MGLFNLTEEDLTPSNEVWRSVVGFEGYYEVSNLGNVRSKKRKLPDGRQLSSHLLKPQGQDYLTVSLWKDNKGNNRLVHRLVAEAFLPNPDNLLEVNHKDMNTANNCVDNLEWVSSKDNTAHRNRNRASSRSYRRSVKCLESGEIFASISAAGRSVTADATQIVESIQAKRCCKGKTFVYADELPEDPEAYMREAQSKYQNYHPRPKMKNSRKVRAIETGQIFDSMAEASRFYNCDTATIRNRINAKKAFNGVTLEYVED